MLTTRLVAALILVRVNVDVASSLLRSTAYPSSVWKTSSRFLSRDGTGNSIGKASADGEYYCGFDTRLMAECTELLYRSYNYCGCWQRVMSFTAPIKIRIATFRHDNYCMLGISGELDGGDQFKENSLRYMVTHDPVFADRVCGVATVHGFVQQAKKLFALKEWADYAKFLSGHMCSNGVTIMGTSWGGAIAEVLAGCANSGSLSDLQGSHLPAFKVDRLYTFGAPPTSFAPISDPYTSSGCFAGHRVFLASEVRTGATDLIAYSTGINGYVHAKQDAIQLIERSDGRFDVKLLRCDAERTSSEPDWATVSPFLENLWGSNGISLEKIIDEGAESHQMAAYVSALHKADDFYNVLGNYDPTVNISSFAVHNATSGNHTIHETTPSR